MIFAIYVGNVGDFGEGGGEFLLVDQAAIKHQLTQVNELALLVLDGLVEVGGRDVAAFPQDFAESFFLHRLEIRFRE